MLEMEAAKDMPARKMIYPGRIEALLQGFFHIDKILFLKNTEMNIKAAVKVRHLQAIASLVSTKNALARIRQKTI